VAAAPDHRALRLVLDEELRDPLLDIAVGPALRRAAHSVTGMLEPAPLPESVVELAVGRADRHRVPEG